MKKHIVSLIALILCLSMALCACGIDTTQTTQTTQPSVMESASTPSMPSTPTDPSTPEVPEIPRFSEMTYARPDLDALQAALESCEKQMDGEKEPLIEALTAYVDLVNGFQTNQSLAYIHYNLDLTDETWDEEFNYCNDGMAAIQSQQDALFRKLAACPYREELEDELFGEGFFDDYDGDSIWTEEYTALIDQELALQADYYSIYAEASASGTIDRDGFQALAELYVQLVKLRHQIAQAAGYDNYTTYSYALEYQRDFSPEQAQNYINQIAQALAPLYLEVSVNRMVDDLFWAQDSLKTFKFVQALAQNAGGTIADCFRLMDEHDLYDISLSPSKMDASFTTFLPDYMVPFVFVDPACTNYDSLTFAHEFGHFCNHYLSAGNVASIDVAEFFSQGMEYLSLRYGNSDLTKLKLYTSLSTYVEQAMLASFELEVYDIPVEYLTVDALRQAYAETLEKFGMGSYVSDTSFVAISHFYIAPQYVISYVVSNDAAMQIYQMEQTEPGKGLSCYTAHLDTKEDQLLSFLEQTGLESPFAPGRIEAVRKIFEDTLK